MKGEGGVWDLSATYLNPLKRVSASGAWKTCVKVPDLNPKNVCYDLLSSGSGFGTYHVHCLKRHTGVLIENQLFRARTDLLFK